MIDLPNLVKPIEIETNEYGCELVVNRWTCEFGQVYLTVNKKTQLAHRIAYEQAYGEIPEGLVVRHKCDNPNCINPRHLELGTHEDNVRDRVERNRSAKGSNNGRAKLTEDDVRYIRSTDETTYSLAQKFGVDRKAIRNIRQFKTWKHVV
jgi:hypothetical protein